VIDAAAGAIRAGRLAILPADTVYGLCTTPYSAAPVERLYRLKGRPETQPTAILASDVDMLFECVPELRGRAGRLVRALLPGSYTLVLPNPARRFRWLTGGRPDAIGVRVPELAGDAAAVLARVGAVAATSANLRGGPEPRRLEDLDVRRVDGIDRLSLERLPHHVRDHGLHDLLAQRRRAYARFDQRARRAAGAKALDLGARRKAVQDAVISRVDDLGGDLDVHPHLALGQTLGDYGQLGHRFAEKVYGRAEFSSLRARRTAGCSALGTAAGWPRRDHPPSQAARCTRAPWASASAGCRQAAFRP